MMQGTSLRSREKGNQRENSTEVRHFYSERIQVFCNRECKDITKRKFTQVCILKVLYNKKGPVHICILVKL